MAALLDPLRNTLDRLALDPKAKEDRRYLVSMLRRLGYSDREIEAVLGWEGDGPRVIELEYERPSQRGDQGSFSLVRDPVWSEGDVEFQLADEGEVEFRVDDEAWPAEEQTWPADDQTAWPATAEEALQETVEPWPESDTPAEDPAEDDWPAAATEQDTLEEAWPEAEAGWTEEAPAQEWATPEAAQETVGFSVARGAPPVPVPVSSAASVDADADGEWTVPEDPALAYGWLLPDDGQGHEEAWRPAEEGADDGGTTPEDGSGWNEPAQGDDSGWNGSAQTSDEAWQQPVQTDDGAWPDAPADPTTVAAAEQQTTEPWPDALQEAPRSADDAQDADAAWTPEEAQWATVDDAAETPWAEEAWTEQESWDGGEWERPAGAGDGSSTAETWDSPTTEMVDDAPTTQQVPDAYSITEAPNRAWTPSWDQDAQQPFTFGDYTLYTRMVELSTGNEQRIYFFAKSQPKSGQPCPLPGGYLVETNERTGLPFLRRDPEASIEAVAWHDAPDAASGTIHDGPSAGTDEADTIATPSPPEESWATGWDDAEADDEPTAMEPTETTMDSCLAITKAGTQCRRTPREGSKYCPVHKGWRGPRAA